MKLCQELVPNWRYSTLTWHVGTGPRHLRWAANVQLFRCILQLVDHVILDVLRIIRAHGELVQTEYALSVVRMQEQLHVCRIQSHDRFIGSKTHLLGDAQDRVSNATTEEIGVARSKESNFCCFSQSLQLWLLERWREENIVKGVGYLFTDLSFGPHCCQFVALPMPRHIAPQNLVDVDTLATAPTASKEAFIIAVPVKRPSYIGAQDILDITSADCFAFLTSNRMLDLNFLSHLGNIQQCWVCSSLRHHIQCLVDAFA
mmetsp:Transcript_28209/g.49265  ORF Transcript_28209/g.49265 Transcript_28209/m.49265 type:complete len:259 (-) Transcript_28209:264-1040(-)